MMFIWNSGSFRYDSICFLGECDQVGRNSFRRECRKSLGNWYIILIGFILDLIFHLITQILEVQHSRW